MPCELCSTSPGWESGRAPTGSLPKRTSRLARPAREITLLDAVEAAEGPFGVTRCIMQNRACGTDAPCAMHDAWEECQEAILKYLQKQSLEDFTTQNPSGRCPPRG